MCGTAVNHHCWFVVGFINILCAIELDWTVRFLRHSDNRYSNKDGIKRRPDPAGYSLAFDCARTTSLAAQRSTAAPMEFMLRRRTRYRIFPGIAGRSDKFPNHDKCVFCKNALKRRRNRGAADDLRFDPTTLPKVQAQTQQPRSRQACLPPNVFHLCHLDSHHVDTEQHQPCAFRVVS